MLHLRDCRIIIGESKLTYMRNGALMYSLIPVENRIDDGLTAPKCRPFKSLLFLMA